ncbi:hypothetical protein C7S15_1564 [Burkholderia cepacia]|nr:hypothetical protein [Burkholderia cepacia]
MGNAGMWSPVSVVGRMAFAKQALGKLREGKLKTGRKCKDDR